MIQLSFEYTARLVDSKILKSACQDKFGKGFGPLEMQGFLSDSS
jgi:hypothetical protein